MRMHFEVGDKVRILETAELGPQVQYMGQVGEIIDVDAGDYRLQFADGRKLYFARSRKLELVPPVEPAQPASSDDLDTLIAKANEGYAALLVLDNKYRDQYTYTDTETKCTSSGYANWRPYKFERKQKPRPKFAAFDTSNGWRVCLDVPHDEIHVGCQRFERKKLTEALRNLIDNNEDGTHVDGLDLGATRKGVEYIEYDGVTPERSHVLPWPDAEAIYEALKKYEQELKP